MQRPVRFSPVQLALLALLISAAVQFAWFAGSPHDPMNDVDYSIFAAQNLLAHGELKGLNLLSDFRDDLAQFAQRRWMVHYPPGHSLLYAAAMGLGLNPSDATKALALTGMLAGGIGWILLARFLGASRSWLVLLASFYPWLPWVANAYRLYETEYVVFAIMPLFCRALLRIGPPVAPQGTPLPNQKGQLALVTLLALLMVGFKYSMSPVFLAAGLYLLIQDGRRFTARSMGWRITVAGLLAAPLILAPLIDQLYGPRVIRLGPAASHFGLPALARNLLDNSVAATLGWNKLLDRLLAIVHLHPFSGLITLVSLASLAVWIAHLRRNPPQDRVRSFGLLLVLLTAALWLSLAASTLLGKGQWNFSAEPRFYMPVTLLWLMFGAVSLDKMPLRAMLRSPALYVLTLPLLLTAAFETRTASRQPPDPAMPVSGIAWKASDNPEHAAFLSAFARAQGRKPDLLIAMPSMMNELAVPSFATGYLVPPGRHYWSSKPLELWALVLPSQEKALLENSAGARIRRVATPAGYPFVFYIVNFEPSQRPRGWSGRPRRW